jgi:hypothetical protein
MKQFRIRTRFQREAFAVSLATELMTNSDPKVAALGQCIVYVLGAPMNLVNGAVLKLLCEHSELQIALGLEVTEPAPRLDCPDYEVADAGMEEAEMA